MKLKKNIVLLLALFPLLVFNCKPTEKKETTDYEDVQFVGSTNDSVEVLKTLSYNKRAVDIYNWTADYLKSAVDNMDIPSEEYDIQSAALRGVYGKLVSAKMEEILTSGSCSHNHALLNELLRAANSLVNSEMNKNVLSQLKKHKADIELHNSILAFGASVSSGGKSATSVHDVYDFSYPDKIISQAKSYSYPYSCQAVNNALNGVKPKLDKRHRVFLESLVRKYIEQSEYNYDIYSKVSAQIDNYYYQGSAGEGAVKYDTDVSSAKRFVDKLIREVEDFNKQHQ